LKTTLNAWKRHKLWASVLLQIGRCHSGFFRPPNSGPGGRRFKSSLPDQSFQALEAHFWFFDYSGAGNFVDGQSHRVQQAVISFAFSVPVTCYFASSRLTADKPVVRQN